MTEPVTFRTIGIIRTPYRDVEGMPIQPTAAIDVAGRIEIDLDLVEGLADVGGFSHLILVYHLHRVADAKLTVTPFLDDRPHGIFATRAPSRPNPIGLSVVRLVGIHASTIDVLDVDMLDGTPLLDIKPYVTAFDFRDGARIGWYAGRLDDLERARADDRFR